MVSLTQTPAVVWSAEGRRTQLMLTQNVGTSVEGTLDEGAKTLRLSVESELPAQVLAYWPLDAAQTTVTDPNGAALTFEGKEFGGWKFLLIDVPAGFTRLTATAQ